MAITIERLQAALNSVELSPGEFLFVYPANSAPRRTLDESGQPLPYVELAGFRVALLTEAEEEW